MSGYVSLKDKGKAIRKILKAEFPDVKFSVRKSGGCAINVSYKDALPVRFVDKFVRSFESIDRCEASGEILSGGNDFIFVDREISDENQAKVKELFEKNFQDIIEDNRLTNYDRENMIWHVYSTTDFRKPITLKYKGGSVREQLVGNLGEKE